MTVKNYEVFAVDDIKDIEEGLNSRLDFDFVNGEWTTSGIFVVVTKLRSEPSTDVHRYKVLYDSDYNALEDKLNSVDHSYVLIDGEIYCSNFMYVAIMCVPNGREIGSTDNYNNLTNKPKINGVTLVGNVTPSELGIIGEHSVNTLTNKTISADDNILTNIRLGNLDSSIIDTETLYTADDTHIASSKLIYEKLIDSKRGFAFKGYVSTTEPSGDIHKGDLWYESSSVEMPTVFPISVKQYNGVTWVVLAGGYSPSSLDLWANKNNNKGYYWFGNDWNLLDFNAGVDNVTITYNSADKLEVKDGGISTVKLANHAVTFDKIATDSVANTINENTPSESKLTTESAVKEFVMGKVSYVHVQNLSKKTWTITHNLNYFPNVTVIDSAGTNVIGEINYTSSNVLEVTFSGEMTGKAFLS